MNPEVQSKIAIFRQKAADNTLTEDDMREAIKILRAGRMSAATASARSKTTAKAAIPNADDMLAELGM
jgi:hypothetical protein